MPSAKTNCMASLVCMLAAVSALTMLVEGRSHYRHRRQVGFGGPVLFNSFGDLGLNERPGTGVLQGGVQNSAIEALTSALGGALRGSGGGQSQNFGGDARSLGAFRPDNIDLARLAARQPNADLDLQGLTSGNFPGLAPIPVPGFPGPQEVPRIPGVNTIPGLDAWNMLVGNLIPQSVPATNALLGGSISRLLPRGTTNDIAKNVFKVLQPASVTIDTDRMMGRWFQVINSPHVIREACTVTHFGALSNNTYSAQFTILKFYREGNPNGPPRFALGYGFKSGESGNFVIHNSNSPDSEPFSVIKVGPLNEFNQYDYAVISNWVRYPVYVLARDAQRFKTLYMRDVLQWLEENKYINVMTKAFNMISPVEYSQCQYTPTFSSAG